MEFRHQNAILQPALLLAEKSCDKGTLKNHIKLQNIHSRKIVHDAVKEISHLSSSENVKQHDAKLEILVILLIKALSDKFGFDDEDDLFTSVTCCVPTISLHFVFDVIKDCNMWLEFCHVLPNLPTKVITVTLLGWLDFFHTSTDEIDMIHLADIVAFLGLTAYSPFYEKIEGLHSDLETRINDGIVPHQLSCSKVLIALSNTLKDVKLELYKTCDEITLFEGLVASLENADFKDDVREAHIKMTLSILLINIQSGFGMVLAPIGQFDTNPSSQDKSPLELLCSLAKQTSSKYINFPKQAILEDVRPDESIDAVPILCQLVIKDHLPLKRVNVRHLNWNQGAITEILNSTSKCFTDSSNVSALFSINVHNFFQDNYEVVVEWLWKHSCIYLFEVIHDNTLNDDNTIIKESIEVVLDNISEEKLTEDLEKNLETCFFIIKHKLSGWRDHLDSILSVKNLIVPDSKWITALEENKHVLMDEYFLVEAVKRLAAMEDVNAEIFQRYKHLLLHAFSQCDFGIQNKVLDHLAITYSGSDLEDMFDVNEDIQDTIRSVLNRVTSDEKISAIPELSTICLQCPEPLILEMIDIASHNRGQIAAFVHIFHHLPALIKFKGEVGADAPIMIINGLAKVCRTSNTYAQQNILYLLKNLLQPYTLYDKEEPPVISPIQFLEKFILPNVTLSSGMTNENKYMWCKLMLTLLDVLHLKDDWSKSQMIGEPIIWAFVIYANINHLSFHRDHVVLREDWLSCADILASIFQKYPDLVSETDMLWLHNRLQDHHWTSVWRVLDILSKNTVVRKLPLPVPDVLLNYLDTQDRVFPKRAGCTDPVMALLQVAAISDTSFDEIKLLLNNDILASEKDLAPRITLCLAMLLPISSSQEWIRLAKCIILMINENILGVSSKCLMLLVQALWIIQLNKNNIDIPWIDMASKLSATFNACKQMQDNIQDVLNNFLIICNIICNWPNQEFSEHVIPLALDQAGSLGSLMKNGNDKMLSVVKRCISNINQEDMRQLIEKAIFIERNG